MGHREAYWPMDKRAGESRDWARRRRKPGKDTAEDVWLVSVGGNGAVGQTTARRRRGEYDFLCTADYHLLFAKEVAYRGIALGARGVKHHVGRSSARYLGRL